MIRLLFIVPYPELRSKVEYVLSHHKDAKRVNADICTMTVEDTPDVPTEEYDAIIARGYTARKTTSMYHQIPTISLSISGYDIIRAIHECAERFHSKKIAICGFEGQLFEAETAGKIMNIDVRVYAPVEHDEISDTMQKALEEEMMISAALRSSESVNGVSSVGMPSARQARSRFARAIPGRIRLSVGAVRKTPSCVRMETLECAHSVTRSGSR